MVFAIAATQVPERAYDYSEVANNELSLMGMRSNTYVSCGSRLTQRNSPSFNEIGTLGPIVAGRMPIIAG